MATPGKGSQNMININNCSVDELASLPNMGRDRAQDIVNHRPYRSWNDLNNVPGISRDVIDNLKNRVTF
ncbi:MAG: hypothetical protein HF314_01650 [Ignavibacteria bacterium]|jgi:DNA uptake protein ComE-like DNA-binding protein|nr:hypothetical protein [Ignavibacteria bacterium]MCU7501747.1 hypothetical protein [Ignavibacteria bacterium]MCU7516846.1 hypothetical protein [Ignavibacteria bacterium]